MKRILSFSLVILLLFSVVGELSFALEADIEMQEQDLEEVQRRREEKEGLLGDTAADRDAVVRNIQEVIVEKQQVQARIEENTVSIGLKEEELEIIKEQLEIAKVEIKAQQEEFGDRLGVMYINQGTGSKLTALLQSKSISDFLIKLEFFKQIAEEDDRVLEALNVKRAEIERLEAQEKENYAQLIKLKEQLEADEARLIDIEAELEARKEELNREIANYQAEINEFAADEQRILSEIQSLQAEMARIRAEAEARRQAEIEAQRQAEEAARQQAEEAASESGEEPDYVAPAPAPEVSRGEESYVGAAGYTWPLPGYSYINSPFGWRTHPVLGVNSFHNGLDIPAPGGTPVVAARGGTVIHAGYMGTFGNTVIIDHGDGMQTLYAHGSGFESYTGQWVEAGQVVMYVGTTGRSTGNHLHFSVIKGAWDFVNPHNYL